jgi:hypothetical protein
MAEAVDIICRDLDIDDERIMQSTGVDACPRLTASARASAAS